MRGTSLLHRANGLGRLLLDRGEDRNQIRPLPLLMTTTAPSRCPPALPRDLATYGYLRLLPAAIVLHAAVVDQLSAAGNHSLTCQITR